MHGVRAGFCRSTGRCGGGSSGGDKTTEATSLEERLAPGGL
jgi:hypothetical protein